MTTTPASEYSTEFIDRSGLLLHGPFATKMIQAMGVSFHKYGAIVDAYPHKMSAFTNAGARWDKYVASHNVDYLVDVANFAMIEYMLPSKKLVDSKRRRSGKLPGLFNRFRLTNDLRYLFAVAKAASEEFESPRFDDAHYDGGDRRDGRLWAGGGGLKITNNQGERF